MVRRKNPTHLLGHAGLNYAYDVVFMDGSYGVKEGSHPSVRSCRTKLFAYDVVIIDGSHGVNEGSHPSVRSCRTKLFA